METVVALQRFERHNSGPAKLIVSQPAKNAFKWRRYQGQLILLSVGWYPAFTLSYRRLERTLREQGWSVDHTSVFRRVQRYGPELTKRCRDFLKSTNRSYRVDETYIKEGKIPLSLSSGGFYWTDH